MKLRSPSPNRIILAADSHAFSHFTECPQKYFLANLQHLRLIKIQYPTLKDGILKTEFKSGAKELGTFIHDMIARVNRLRIRAIKRKVPFDYCVTDQTLIQVAFKRIALRKWEKPEDVLFHQMKFMEFYSLMKNEYRWLKPLGYEVGFSKVLYEDRDVCFIYEGRIDFVGQSDSGIHWVDYKSQSRETVLYENTNQFLGYSWALGANLGFVQYYGLQKDKPKIEAFRLKSINHTAGLIEQWKKETTNQFRKMASLIPFGEAGFERIRSSCNSGKYSDCQFIKICDNAHTPQVIPGIKRIFYKIEPWHAFRTNGENE